MVEWLNANQGFVMSVLTFVYVAATIIIVIYNSKMIRESRLTRENESRPYIFAYLEKEPRDHWFILKIKNYGKIGANIDSFIIDPLPQFSGDLNPSDILDNTIIAPNQMLRLMLIEDCDTTADKEFNIQISYKSVGNDKKYVENYNIKAKYKVLTGYSESTKSKLSDMENAVVNISHYIDSINNKM